MSAIPDPTNRRRRALVTGAGGGIGLAVAVALLQQGHQVAMLDINGARVREQAHRLGAMPVEVDVTQFDAVSQVVAQLGPFDTLVNAAGVDQHQFFTQSTPADWRHLLAVNLEGVLNTTLAVLPGMQAQGFGRVVNVASEAGRLGSKGGSVYAAAKGGVIAFTRSIARENGHLGITANAVAPGPIDTPMVQAAVQQHGDRLMQAMVNATLVRRLGTPDEAAAAVVFLVSDAAAYITGEVLGVSGGMGCGA